MASPDPPTLLRAVTLAARSTSTYRTRRDKLILQARAAGLTHAEIGRAAGMSRQRVQQIVKGAENGN